MPSALYLPHKRRVSTTTRCVGFPTLEEWVRLTMPASHRKRMRLCFGS